MKVFLEEIGDFLTVLKEKGIKEVYLSLKREASDFTETQEGLGKFYRFTLLLQAFKDQNIYIFIQPQEAFIQTEDDLKKFTKKFDKNVEKTINLLQKECPDALILRGVVEA
jgi:hypothetical protein